MIFLLFFFLGSTSTVFGDDDGSSEVLTTCKIADNVRSALYILNKMPEDDLFITDEVVLTDLLRSALNTSYPNLVGSINTAQDFELCDLASMKGMLSNLDDLTVENGAMSWADIDSLQALRIGFEQLALLKEDDEDRRDYLSTWMAKLTTKEVLTLSCASQGDLTNDNRKTSKNFLDGCYSDLTDFEPEVGSSAGVYHCIAECRNANKKFSVFTSGICKCSSNGLHVAGTYDGTCKQAPNKMIKTGLGEPILNDVVAFFDVADQGYPQITNDDLISIKEVEMMDGSSSIYLVALFKKAVALFKEGETGLQLVDWKRWDSTVCDPTLDLNDRCLHRVKLVEAEVFPGYENRVHADALAFTTFKVMTTLNHTMTLDSDNAFEEIKDDPAVKTGDPMVFSGGKMVDHVLISFGEAQFYYPFALLRLENEKIVHLTEALNFGSSYFGNFYVDSDVKYPVTFTHRVIGRETYVFVGCHDVENIDEAAIKLFKIKERQRDVTNYAAYGAIEMGEIEFAIDDLITTNFIGDMMYVQTIYPMLIVLDSDPATNSNDQPQGSRVRVYRISKFTTLSLQDELDITERYTSLDYISLDTGKYLILKSSNSMVMLKMSSKGILSRDLRTEYPTFKVADTIQYGKLQDNAIISVISEDSTLNEIYTLAGNKIDETAISIVPSKDYKVMKCISRDQIRCFAVSFANDEARFETFKSTPYSNLNVATNDITLTNWEASKKRIDSMFSFLTPVFTGLVDKQKDYLMTSGSIVPSGSNWQLKSLKASSFTGALGVLDGTAVTMNIVDSTTGAKTAVNYTPNGDEASGTDCRDALDIQLDVVTTKIGVVTTKTAEFNSTFLASKLSLSSTETQTITNAKVNLVDSTTISSVNSITVDELKATDGTTKSLSDLISKTFLKNDVKPLTGKKTFNDLIRIVNLETAVLSDEGDDKVTVSPAECFVKNRDTTITVSQTFNNPVTIVALKIEGDASIVNTDGNHVLKAEDFVPHSSRSGGLPGFFSFQDAVNADGLHSHIDGFPLKAGDAANMALKNSANTIAGNLTVNLIDAPGNTASGTCILLKQNVLLNNVDLINKKMNAVRTSCEGCTTCNDNCVLNVVQIMSPVTFAGTVSASSLDLTTVNNLSFDSFIDKTEFNQSEIIITGNKTLNNVNANILLASTFHELELNTLLTTNSVQNVAGAYTFNKVSEFASINTPAESPCVPVDSKNLCEIFKSDLKAVKQSESWIQSNTIDTDIKFNQLTIKSGAGIKFDNLVNGMVVGDVVDKMVTDENKAFTITGTKTIASDINLQSVRSSTIDTEVNIISGENTNTVSDFVNTETTTEITGPKTFSSPVSFENIFAVGSSLINDLSVAHMLHCFVDKNSDLSGDSDIHILHPVHYHTISVPKLIVERDSAADHFGAVPFDTSIQTAAAFVEVVANDQDSLVSEMFSQYGLQISDIEDISLDAMFSYVLKDQENLSGLILSGAILSGLNLSEKRNQLNLLLNRRFGLTMTSVQALTDLKALQTVARNPKVNTFDPSTDLALLGSDNVFCTAEANCIQNFDGGFEAESVQVSGDLKILDDKLVHTVNPSVLDADRISLSKTNNDVTYKKFTSLSLKPSEGLFSGSLNIQTSNGYISSNDFPSKFMSKSIPAEQTQTVHGSLVMASIQAQDTTANQLKINGQAINLSAVDSATYNVDDDLTFEQLTFQNDVTIHNSITVAGKVEDEKMEDFRDVLVTGADIVVDSFTTIAGTNRAQLDLIGKKTLSSLTVDNLVPTKLEGGVLNPDFAYLPCTMSQQITGPLSGPLLNTLTGLSSVDECNDRCRDKEDGMCYGISYLEAGAGPSQCRLYASYEANALNNTVADWESYVSYTFECCCRLKAVDSDLFLSVLENDVITTSSSPDFWCFGNNDKIVHKSTDKVIALDGETLLLSDVPRSSSKTATRTDETFTFTLPGTSVIQIQSKSALKWVNKDADNSIVLEDVASTSWRAYMGGVVMSEIVDGNIQSRLLLKSKPQTVTGTVAVRGDMTVEDTTLITPTISTLSHDDVTAVYNWNDPTSTHEVSTAFEITGSSLTVTNLDSASYNTDLNDFIQLDTIAEDLKLQGKTTFTDVKITTNQLTVTGTVAGQDIADLDTNLARNNVETLTFTAKNTFSQNDGNTASLTTTGLTSSVDMTLTNSQIQGGVDLVDLRAKSILDDDASATIQGTVIFDKVLMSGGSVTMGKANLNEGGEIDVPSAFIQTTDSSLNLTEHKVGTFTANNALTINGQLFGYDAEKFLDVFYKDGAQMITADLTSSGKISVTGHLTTNSINGFTPENDLVLLNGEVTMDTDTTFTQTLSITNAVVTGEVDGFNFLQKFKDSVAVADADNIISEKWTITSASQFEGSVVGVATPDDRYINEQRVSDMNAASALHDNIYAVKVSAQAEASVLCDFVSDLQDSYLSGQEVVYYRKKSSTSFTGKNFTNNVMKTTKDNEVYLFVMSGLDLEVYQVEGANIQMVKMLAIDASASGTLPKLQLVVDITVDSSFSFLIFVGSGVPGDIVQMVKFTGTSGGTRSISSMGFLENATTVSEVNMHYILVLKHILNANEVQYDVGLVGYACHHLKSCELNCGNVSPDVLLNTGDVPGYGILENRGILEPVSMRSIQVLSGHYVVAFNMESLFEQKTIVICVFEKTTEGVFNNIKTMIDSTSTSHFQLAEFDAKIIMLSVGTTFEMKEISIELGKFIDRTACSVSNQCDGEIFDFKIENDFGSGYDLSVLVDGNELYSVKYWGADGLKVISHFSVENFYQSIGSTTAVVDSKMVYLRALVGFDIITILQGDFASQSTYVKFECAKPEIPAAWVPAPQD